MNCRHSILRFKIFKLQFRPYRYYVFYHRKLKLLRAGLNVGSANQDIIKMLKDHLFLKTLGIISVHNN